MPCDNGIGRIAPYRHIRNTIDCAISTGWAPQEGPDLEIGCDTTTNPIVFHDRPDKASQKWFFDWWAEQNPDVEVITQPTKREPYSEI